MTTYKGITSKYQNWKIWQEIMHDLTGDGMSNQKAAKMADAIVDDKRAKMQKRIARK